MFSVLQITVLQGLRALYPPELLETGPFRTGLLLFAYPKLLQSLYSRIEADDFNKL